MRKGFVLVFLLALSIPAFAATVDDCERYKGVQVGPYYIGPGYWNKEKCPGEQCLKIDDKTGDFTVVKDTFDCGYGVASYPYILYGSSWGVTSGAKDLPAPISSLKNLLTDWTIQTTRTGAWDAAYDIWVCPDNKCGGDGFNGGAEVMVWLDYFNCGGWQYKVGDVSIEGIDWEVWQTKADAGPNNHWQYVAYVPKTLMSSIQNFDLLPFFQDSVQRGFLKPDWWVYAIEAGNEIHTKGVPFASKNFSVTVNSPNPGPFTFKRLDAPIKGAR